MKIKPKPNKESLTRKIFGINEEFLQSLYSKMHLSFENNEILAFSLTASIEIKFKEI